MQSSGKTIRALPPASIRAYCKWGKQYRDPGFRRWLCLLRWDVLTDDLVRVIALRPSVVPLGSRDKPHASRRGKYLPEWIRANGGPPARRDRLSPECLFTGWRAWKSETRKALRHIPWCAKSLNGRRVSGSLSQQVTPVKEGPYFKRRRIRGFRKMLVTFCALRP